MEEISELRQLGCEFFKYRSYSDKVKTYVIVWLSIHEEGIYYIVKPSQPKYINGYKKPLKKYRDIIAPMKIEKHFSIEVMVPYDELSAQGTKIERWNVVGKSIIKYLREMEYPNPIRTFDRERFNHDMEEFFHSIGCTLE